MRACDVAKGSRVLTRDGVAVMVIEAWSTGLGYLRAFIGEDEKGRRHFFEHHNESEVREAA